MLSVVPQARQVPCLVFTSLRVHAIQEVFGEDTYHMGHMAMQYTLGLQYDVSVPKYLKVAACTKVCSIAASRLLLNAFAAGLVR